MRRPDGSEAKQIGALHYVESFDFFEVLPASGSVNGGETVVLHGQGLPQRLGDFQVLFGGIAVDTQVIKVLDGKRYELKVPPGALGPVDVTITTRFGKRVTRTNAYTYQKAAQQVINTGRYFIHDATLDASQQFLFTAEGMSGVSIYEINASSQ